MHLHSIPFQSCANIRFRHASTDFSNVERLKVISQEKGADFK